jgi:cell division protein FtsZ
MTEDLMNFDLPMNKSSIIKVIGVGGGGSNAVNHMYRNGIKDVDFVVCNTDAQALANSPIQVKIQLPLKTSTMLSMYCRAIPR